MSEKDILWVNVFKDYSGKYWVSDIYVSEDKAKRSGLSTRGYLFTHGIEVTEETKSEEG